MAISQRHSLPPATRECRKFRSFSCCDAVHHENDGPLIDGLSRLSRCFAFSKADGDPDTVPKQHAPNSISPADPRFSGVWVCCPQPACLHKTCGANRWAKPVGRNRLIILILIWGLRQQFDNSRLFPQNCRKLAYRQNKHIANGNRCNHIGRGTWQKLVPGDGVACLAF